MIVLDIPAPLDHQVEEDLSPARFKLFHHGRRWGKDRVAFKGAVAGHGPWDGESPAFPGAAQGWWVGWVVRDFTQGLGIWREEFLPRFDALKPTVTVNRSELRIGLPNGGGLFMCTAENVHSLRGLGKRMKGLVLNEAAHFDLEEAWLAVLRALLVDNRGWAILMSTPNSGPDGNAAGLVPSYFNRLCLQAKTGALGDEWAVFGGDLRENPVIVPSEADAFLRDLTPGTLRYEEEGLGLLVQSGAGLAFPSWHPKVHLAPWREIPEEWACLLCMDWGISTDNLSCVIALRVGPKGQIAAVKEWTWTGKDAKEAGEDFAADLLLTGLPRWPEWMVVDSAMNERTGVGGSTILSEWQAGLHAGLSPYGMQLVTIPAPKGPGSRRAMFNQITKVLSWGPELADGTVPASRMPLLQIVSTTDGRPSCPTLAKDLATAPKKADDDDVDKKKALFAAGDALGYGLSLILPKADRVEPVIAQDQHPGWVIPGVRRSRDRSPEQVAKEKALIRQYVAQQKGERLGGRYGENPRGRR